MANEYIGVTVYFWYQNVQLIDRYINIMKYLFGIHKILKTKYRQTNKNCDNAIGWGGEGVLNFEYSEITHIN